MRGVRSSREGARRGGSGDPFPSARHLLQLSLARRLPGNRTEVLSLLGGFGIQDLVPCLRDVPDVSPNALVLKV